MSVTLLKGQKVDLTKKHPDLQEVTVGLGWDIAGTDFDLDASVFLLGGNGKVESEGDFVFYNNPIAGEGSVLYHGDSRIGSDHGDSEQIEVRLSKVPPHVERLSFTVTIHDAEQKGQHFGQLNKAYIRTLNRVSGEEILRFDLGKDFTAETAIVAADLYRHNGEWKFNPVARGFHGGLAALCAHFGVETDEEAAPAEALPAPVPESKPAAPVLSQAKLSKIELKKKETVNIQKSTRITAHLEWDADNKDLDLYCFYVTKAGEQGKVYWKDLGSADSMPYITLSGDSQNKGQETILIHRPDELKYLLFAAYSALSNGIGSFKSMRARAVVDNHLGSTVTAPLLEENKYAYWVAIAHVDLTIPGSMKVSHVEAYSGRHKENSPVLFPDGTFQMDIGPIEFKRDGKGFFGGLFGKK